MADPIEKHYVPTFKANLEFLLEDEGGRLDGSTLTGEHHGKITSVVDQFSSGEASEITGGNQDIITDELPRERRHLDPRDWDYATKLERRDKIRVLTDPTGVYVMAHARAHRKRMDRSKLDAMFAAAKTGETGGTSTVFDTTNQVVAVDEAANSVAVGLTVDKLKKALSIFGANELDLENEELHCAMNWKQNLNLIKQIEVIHGDYTKFSGVRVEKGFVREYMGITFHHKERANGLPYDSGTNYDHLPIWAKSGVYHGMWPEEIEIDIYRMKGKRGHPWWVYSCKTHNATRTNEKKVVQVKCA